MPAADVELERTVIRALFLSRSAADVAFGSLKEEAFHDPRWRVIFRAALGEYQSTGRIDEALLLGRLEGDSIEALRYALSCEPRPVEKNLPAYCRKLLVLAEARHVGARAKQALDVAETFGGDTDGLRSAACAVANAAGSFTDAQECSDAAVAVQSYLRETLSPAAHLRIPTGLDSIDVRLNGGMAAGNLIVLGARRGVGKSAVGISIVNVALGMGKSVVWITQEMTAEEVTGRLVVMRAQVETAERRGNFSPEEQEALTRAAGDVEAEAARLTIYERPITPARLEILCRRWKATGKLDMLGIDYLQRMKLQRGDHTVQAIEDAVHVTKDIAKEHKIPVLCLAQCRRESERGQQTDKRVFMSDFKGSGAIEEDADVAILMWPGKFTGTLDGELAKNRHGKTGLFTIGANFDVMRFGGSQESIPAATAGNYPEDRRAGDA